MDNIIEINKLNKYFHVPSEFHVLKDLNFAIQKEKLTTLTGKSGSGKSTLLYLLSTMDTDYSGEIRINGETVTGKSRNWLAKFRNDHIGFVFQFHYLLPEFTVLSNVMLPATKQNTRSKDEVEARAMELLKLLDVSDQATKRASMLSGGQQQRVAIARAMINNPAIIIGDEPTGNLDSRNTAVVIDLFKQLAYENGQTILVVTHDDDFARKSDNNIYMIDGKIKL